MANIIRLSGSLIGEFAGPGRSLPLLGIASLGGVRGLKRWADPPVYKPLDIPFAERRLSILEKTPQYPAGLRPMKEHKELDVIRGK